jgi:hypothetical protein
LTFDATKLLTYPVYEKGMSFTLVSYRDYFFWWGVLKWQRRKLKKGCVGSARQAVGLIS